MGTNTPGEVPGRSDMHGTVQSVGAAAEGFHGPRRSCNQLGAEHKSPRTNDDRAPSNIYSCMEPPASPVPSEVSALIVPEVSVFEDVPSPPLPRHTVDVLRVSLDELQMGGPAFLINDM